MTLPIWVLVLGLLGALAVVFLVHRHHLAERHDAERRAERHVENLRREQTKQVERLRREHDRATRSGHVEFVGDLAGRLDGLRRALEEADRDRTEKADLVEGIGMTLRQIDDLLERYDIELVEPAASEPFDPEYHEAVRAVDETEVEPGTVVTCHRPGYRFRDRVIRPAQVEVAVGRDSEASPSDEEEVRAEREEADRNSSS